MATGRPWPTLEQVLLTGRSYSLVHFDTFPFSDPYASNAQAPRAPATSSVSGSQRSGRYVQFLRSIQCKSSFNPLYDSGPNVQVRQTPSTHEPVAATSSYPISRAPANRSSRGPMIDMAGPTANHAAPTNANPTNGNTTAANVSRITEEARQARRQVIVDAMQPHSPVTTPRQDLTLARTIRAAPNQSAPSTPRREASPTVHRETPTTPTRNAPITPSRDNLTHPNTSPRLNRSAIEQAIRNARSEDTRIPPSSQNDNTNSSHSVSGPFGVISWPPNSDMSLSFSVNSGRGGTGVLTTVRSTFLLISSSFSCVGL